MCLSGSTLDKIWIIVRMVPFSNFILFKHLVFYFLLWSPVERYCGCQDPDGGNSRHRCCLFRPEFLTNEQAHQLSLIWFLAYIEAYVYHEEDIDQADVDKYEKTSLGFMDYDVSNIFRHIQNIISSFMNIWFSVIFWQLIYFFICPFLMFKETGANFLVSLKRDMGACLKNNSTPTKIRPVSPPKVRDEGIVLNKVTNE